MKKYILALDEGTTSARAILFDKNSSIVAMAQHEFPQIYPKAGWVEQDPMEIYACQYASLTECVAKSGVSPEEIAAVGITNQRETVIVWIKTRESRSTMLSSGSADVRRTYAASLKSKGTPNISTKTQVSSSIPISAARRSNGYSITLTAQENVQRRES